MNNLDCSKQLHITAGITTLTHLKYDIKVFAPFVLPRDNWSFGSGKTNGVMPADVRRHGRPQVVN
jgi:hypothetical protein